ncbi:MAG: ABC transporter ATP-binding protein [Deltaproteobacteria bacterium HGW-Deltaproteobacteria-10]|nr:MAG: ABC transporter ATP-binding protein [Deltaproteobacteria bacterium HGW-Deltaproteobacteria-10]
MIALSANSPPLVEVKNVSVRFNTVEALKDVSLTVAEGNIFGLVGSDGAGKSTLLRLIATMISPTQGNIIVNGLDVVSERQKIKTIIGYMPQRFGLYQDLSVEENIDFFMDIFNIAQTQRKMLKDKYLGFSNLLPFLDRPAGALSGGMKQKLGLACVLVHEPKLLILDEPTNGVDPVSRSEFWDILANMRKEGMTIMVSTAYLDEGEKCDQLALMHNAVILESSTPAAMRQNFTTLEEAMIDRITKVDKGLVDDTFHF